MKGIILAGGLGTRLYPITKVVSKQLLPIYNKPMIYYPLSVLMLANIRDILIISNPDTLELFKHLLGDGSDLGIKLSYLHQVEPKGIAEAFIIGEKFIGKDNVTLILGDNIFFGHKFPQLLENVIKQNINGATLFIKEVRYPQEYGIIEFDNNGKVISIEEKPKNPKSNFAITGMYVYDNQVVEYAKLINPSARGEIEISCINNLYLQAHKISVEVLGRGIVWLDSGTPETFMQANEYVYTVEKNQGFSIACIEEIAYLKSFISLEQLHKLSYKYGNSPYAQYLKNIT